VIRQAKRSLGQNFLVDKNIQRKVVEALGAGPADEVVEIGPGRGALTSYLAGRVARLTLIELDDHLARGLRDAYGERSDVQVIHADVLDVRMADLAADPSRVRVVGNIPYNITTPIVFHLLERPRPASILLMVQKEVAERLVAPPDTGEYGALSVGVRTLARVERVFDVPRGAFRPVPKVDSAVVSILPEHPPVLSTEDELSLRVLTRAAFQWRRKQMQKTLRDHPDLTLSRAGIDRVEEETRLALTRRPETFSPEEFVRLSRAVVALERNRV
jgi:16S rRNA (adenine1518-N6/adenine1519-N6)-dimethyltransferase